MRDEVARDGDEIRLEAIDHIHGLAQERWIEVGLHMEIADLNDAEAFEGGAQVSQWHADAFNDRMMALNHARIGIRSATPGDA